MSFAKFSSMPENRIFARNAVREEIPDLFKFATDYFGKAIAPLTTVLDIYDAYGEGLWVAPNDEAKGGYSAAFWYLPITQSAADCFMSGEGDFSQPNARMICPDLSQAAALYGWILISKGRGKLLILKMHELLTSGEFSRIDGLALGYTAQGRSILKALGFATLPNVATDQDGAERMVLRRSSSSPCDRRDTDV